jgi:isocitrate/isopropylmalate dehydrogenase
LVDTKTRSGTTLLVLPGDGIGPEIVAATLEVLDAADRQFNLGLAYESTDIGFAALAASGTTTPDAVVERAKQAAGVILGPVSHNDYPPVAEGGLNPSGELRRRLDLFANIRPARSRPGLPARCGRDIDLVIVRENTEGFYADRSKHVGPGEFMPTPDVALSVRKITREGSERIVEAAFSLAARRGKRVTVVHKANVLRLSDGFFLACARRVASVLPSARPPQLQDRPVFVPAGRLRSRRLRDATKRRYQRYRVQPSAHLRGATLTMTDTAILLFSFPAYR